MASGDCSSPHRAGLPTFFPNLDGSELEDLATVGVFEPVRIALDLPAAKMYWTDSSPANFTIHRANLDGTDRELIDVIAQSPSGIALVSQPAAVKRHPTLPFG